MDTPLSILTQFLWVEDEREGDEFEVIVLSVGLPVNGRPHCSYKKSETILSSMLEIKWLTASTYYLLSAYLFVHWSASPMQFGPEDELAPLNWESFNVIRK